MKKIIFIMLVFIFLIGCDKKGCNNEVFEFGHLGVLTFYIDESPNDVLKNIKVRIISKGKERIINLEDKSIKVNNFVFDEVGEYIAGVQYKNRTYSLKYKVEIRKWDGKSDTSWYDENKDIFEIDNANQLAGLASLVNNGNNFENKKIVLKYDVDLNNLPWEPIGSNGIGCLVNYDKYFSGNFDGNNKTIYNLFTKAKHDKIGEHLDQNTSYYHFGLFGYVKNAVINNVTLYNVNIINGMTNGFVRSMQGTGALVGHSSGEVSLENNKVLGNILIKGEYKVGGIVGSSSGNMISIKNCYIRGDTSSFIGGSDALYKDTNNFGGVLGFSSSLRVELENIISDINVDGFTCGGIIGNAVDGDVTLKNTVPQHLNSILPVLEETGCEIEIIDNTEKTEQQELVEDLVQIITVFSCKLQGKRANKAKRMIRELTKDEKDL